MVRTHASRRIAHIQNRLLALGNATGPGRKRMPSIDTRTERYLLQSPGALLGQAAGIVLLERTTENTRRWARIAQRGAGRAGRVG